MKKYPLLMKPYACYPLWSGAKLKNQWNKNGVIDGDKVGELWEISTVEGRESFVANGEYNSKKLNDVLSLEKIYTQNGIERLPLLYKLIDTDGDLSIQVHPDDAYALKNENQLGKNESWIVLDCDKDASIMLGFNDDYTEEQIRNAINDGTLENMLNRVKVKVGDYFRIESGTVHALGKGVTIGEIQQSSAVTYRLYDFNRIDKDGNKRELHVEKALDVLNRNKYTVPNVSCATDIPDKLHLVDSTKFYKVYAIELTNRLDFSHCDYAIISVVDGECVLDYNDGEISAKKGDSFFIPAMLNMVFKNKAKLLIFVEK